MIASRFRTKMLLVTVIPVIMTALILAYVLITGRIDEFNKRIDDKGNNAANYLSIMSEYGIFTNNFGYLQSTLSHTINQQDVVAIYIENNSKTVVLKKINTGYENFNLIDPTNNRFKLFQANIIKTSIAIDDIESIVENIQSENIIGRVKIVMDLKRTETLKNEIIRDGVLTTLLLTFATILAAILFSRTVTGPIGRIHKDVNIIKQGDLKHRILVDFSGELAELASGINNMTSSLEQAHHEELLRNEALSAAKKEAECANRAKTLFLSSMSHEMRTPMNAILGFSQLIELDSDDDEIKNHASEIIRSSRHLLELIEGLLDISQIESGNLTISIECISLREILEFCISMVQPSADELSVHIENKAGLLPDVNIAVDNKHFKQVLLNILSNAIKYNIKDGSVIIDYAIEKDKMLVLSVTDTGKGIDQENQKNIFNYFDRAGKECSNITGSGLGLAISKNLIERMNGVIEFESNVNEGSRFYIKVPLA